MGRWSIALGLLPLLVPGVIDGLGWVEGTDANPAVLLGGTTLLVVLAFLRGARLLGSEARSRELLRLRERYSTAIAANSSDAVLVLDDEGLILNDAPQFAALVGLPDEPTRGMEALLFFRPVDPAVTAAAFADAMRAPGDVFEHEFEMTRNDGQPSLDRRAHREPAR